MDELFGFVDRYVIPHWPWFTWAFAAFILGQIFKRTLWTKENAAKRKPHWFWWWMRKTMAAHPMVVGIVIGFIWLDPEPNATGFPKANGYFALAGMVSVWGFDLGSGIYEAIFHRKLSLKLPGFSDPPPEESPPSD